MTPALRVTDEVFARFPDAVLGVVVARGIDNTGDGAPLAGPLRQEEERVRAALAGAPISEHPHIAPWREAYRRFGAKPKDYPSSIENLARRVLKGWSVPHVNPLVDLYNAISLRHLLPVGGEDLDRVRGDVLLALASDQEVPVHLLGEPEARPPKPGEVIYKDDLGTLCRRWNWKEAERTKLTAETRNAVLVIEGLPPAGRDLVERATGELAALIREHCGGEIRAALIDRGHPRAPLA
ncbi:MAG TPA: phenylalanine--tRNA ligase beta subunit-related protein [Gemmatimonadales bacterium]|nr:phenylalanine--tRNA ligase beta subunit-related protein [Gemmatimonadales bacterium]